MFIGYALIVLNFIALVLTTLGLVGIIHHKNAIEMRQKTDVAIAKIENGVLERCFVSVPKQPELLLLFHLVHDGPTTEKTTRLVVMLLLDEDDSSAKKATAASRGINRETGSSDLDTGRGLPKPARRGVSDDA